MDSFVEAQNNLKRMSYAGCVILFKTRQSHAVRFSFMPMVMKSPGLKPIEAQNARSSSACVPYLATMCQERSFIDNHHLRSKYFRTCDQGSEPPLDDGNESSDDFRCTPDSGHRRPARPCPKSANFGIGNPDISFGTHS